MSRLLSRSAIRQFELSALPVSIGAVLFGAVIGVAILISPLVGVLLVGGLAAMNLLLPHPLRVAYLLILAIVLTSAIPRNQFLPMFKPNELALALACAVLFLTLPPQGEARYIPGVLLLAILIFAVGTSIAPTLSYYTRHISQDMESLFVLLAPLQYLAIFWFFVYIANTTRQRFALIQFMFLCCSLVAAVGLLQAANVPPVNAVLHTLYPSDHTAQSADAGRVTSVMGAWNALGTFLMANLIVALAVWSYPAKRLYRINITVMFVLTLACLVATNFYSCLIGLAIGFAILDVFQPIDRKFVVVGVVLFALMVLVMWPAVSARLDAQFSSGRLLPQTIEYRIELWDEYFIPSIANSPVWGVSPTSDHILYQHPESQYVYLLFRSGAISLVAHVLWIALLVGWLALHVRQRKALSGRLAAATIALLIVLSVMGITNPVFTYSGTSEFLWMNLGLVVSEGISTQ